MLEEVALMFRTTTSVAEAVLLLTPASLAPPLWPLPCHQPRPHFCVGLPMQQQILHLPGILPQGPLKSTGFVPQCWMVQTFSCLSMNVIHIGQTNRRISHTPCSGVADHISPCSPRILGRFNPAKIEQDTLLSTTWLVSHCMLKHYHQLTPPSGL